MSEPIIKTVFIGLDNSGKTSILYTLEGKFAQIANIKPTIRFTRTDFNILGLPIKIWDMGGQEQYRIEYLSKEKFFIGTDLLFYVIDVQDTNRFTESVEYFLNILEVFEKINPDQYPHIEILLHKSDPYIKDLPDLKKKVQTLKGLFSELVKFVDLTFHETSVYDFESLSRAFVKGTLKVLPKGEIIQEVLKEFMQKTESSAIMLLDDNVLVIAESYIDSQSKNVCHICGPYFVNMLEKLSKYELFVPDTIEVEMQGWLFFKHINYLKTHFYLVFFTKVHENFHKINDLLPAFTKDLFNLIKYIL
ncbi:MAG: 50S ribosome-binding GTPase [Candidatus Helarchaeota archaeon]|nr:50S ribosome-binding GTPase [Candidatus Helarchaeota archaeon]